MLDAQLTSDAQLKLRATYVSEGTYVVEGVGAYVTDAIASKKRHCMRF